MQRAVPHETFDALREFPVMHGVRRHARSTPTPRRNGSTHPVNGYLFAADARLLTQLPGLLATLTGLQPENARHQEDVPTAHRNLAR